MKQPSVVALLIFFTTSPGLTRYPDLFLHSGPAKTLKVKEQRNKGSGGVHHLCVFNGLDLSRSGKTILTDLAPVKSCHHINHRIGGSSHTLHQRKT